MNKALLAWLLAIVGISAYAQNIPDSTSYQTSFRKDEDGVTMTQTSQHIYKLKQQDRVCNLSDQELGQLFRRQDVTSHQNPLLPLPHSVLLGIRVASASIKRDYGVRDGQIKMLAPPVTILSEPRLSVFSVLLSFFWLYLPGFCLWRYLFANDQGLSDMLVFLTLGFAAVLISIFTGSYWGPLAGAVLGTIFSVILMIISSNWTNRQVLNYPFSGPAVIMMLSFLNGFYAGFMKNLGFTWNSGEFLVIWQCLLYLLVICALAVTAKIPALGYKAKTPRENKVDNAS